MRNDENKNEIVIYVQDDGTPDIHVRLDNESVWVTQTQLVELFQSSKANISEHIKNIFTEGELEEKAVVRKIRTTASDGKSYLVLHYNLDLIISVGYRVKSKTATNFRIWANGVLKKYLLDGAAINESRLKELGQVIQILNRSQDELVSGVAEVLGNYLPGLTLLRDYDASDLQATPKTMPGWRLTIEEAREVIKQSAAQFPADNLFGNERGDALEGIVNALYQGFAGHELYPTVEEKAANLLYLVIKDHPLSDGNKRSAAALFVTFLAHNNILFESAGVPRISNNALAAITLLVAMSDPAEKELMVELVIRMLTDGQQPETVRYPL